MTPCHESNPLCMKVSLTTRFFETFDMRGLTHSSLCCQNMRDVRRHLQMEMSTDGSDGAGNHLMVSKPRTV